MCHCVSGEHYALILFISSGKYAFYRNIKTWPHFTFFNPNVSVLSVFLRWPPCVYKAGGLPWKWVFTWLTSLMESTRQQMDPCHTERAHYQQLALCWLPAADLQPVLWVWETLKLVKRVRNRSLGQGFNPTLPWYDEIYSLYYSPMTFAKDNKNT